MYVHRLACIKISDIRFDYIWTEFAEVLSPKLSTVHIHKILLSKFLLPKILLCSTPQRIGIQWNASLIYVSTGLMSIIWYSSNVMLHSLTIFPCVK